MMIPPPPHDTTAETNSAARAYGVQMLALPQRLSAATCCGKHLEGAAGMCHIALRVSIQHCGPGSAHTHQHRCSHWYWRWSRKCWHMSMQGPQFGMNANPQEYSTCDCTCYCTSAPNHKGIPGTNRFVFFLRPWQPSRSPWPQILQKPTSNISPAVTHPSFTNLSLGCA